LVAGQKIHDQAHYQTPDIDIDKAHTEVHLLIALRRFIRHRHVKLLLPDRCPIIPGRPGGLSITRQLLLRLTGRRRVLAHGVFLHGVNVVTVVSTLPKIPPR
jgi:hypothetical protein